MEGKRSARPGAVRSVHFFVPASMATGVVKYNRLVSASCNAFSKEDLMSKPAFMQSATYFRMPPSYERT